jgi:hypothetical protein
VAHAPLNHRFGNVVGWLLEQPLPASQKHVCSIDPNESGDCKALPALPVDNKALGLADSAFSYLM